MDTNVFTIERNGEVKVTPLGELCNNFSFLKQNNIQLLISPEDYVEKSPLYLIPVEQDGRIGFINKQAEIVLPLEYSGRCGEFINDSSIVTVEKNDSWGAINSVGDVIIPFEYTTLYPQKHGLMCARSHRSWGYIDMDNNVVVPFIYGWADPYFVAHENSEIGYARVIQDGKWGIINTKGEIVAPAVYDNIWSLKPEYLSAVRAEIAGRREIIT